MVKIFTIVKDEVDIVQDWVLYHGNIFGFHNLHVFDNMSTDGTWRRLLDLKRIYPGIYLYRCNDYRKKGEYMTWAFSRFCRREIGIPMDIDEFIVLGQSQGAGGIPTQITCDPVQIRRYVYSLPPREVYKMNYIQSKLTASEGYSRAAMQCEWGTYVDSKDMARLFLHSQLFHGKIDHGNHYPNGGNWALTRLCLVHYHCRNAAQMISKIRNNVAGFGYPLNDIDALRRLLANRVPGYHHVENQIKILKGTYALPLAAGASDGDISLAPVAERLALIEETIEPKPPTPTTYSSFTSTGSSSASSTG